MHHPRPHSEDRIIGRRLRLPVLLAAALVVSGPAVAESSGRAIGTLTVRTGPGTSYAPVTTAPAGAKLGVGSCSNWCSVTYKGKKGYATSNMISKRPPATTKRQYAPKPTLAERFKLPELNKNGLGYTYKP